MSASFIRLTPQELDDLRLERDIAEILAGKTKSAYANSRAGSSEYGIPWRVGKPGWQLVPGGYRRSATLHSND